jgi:hypothetical protein
MSKNNNNKVIAHLDTLKLLARGANSKSQIRKILGNSPGLLKCIQEIALNILESRVLLTKPEFALLSQHRAFMRRVGRRHLSLKALRRNLLSNSLLLPHLVIPVLRAYKISMSSANSTQ